jgi:hypothetical protein
MRYQGKTIWGKKSSLQCKTEGCDTANKGQQALWAAQISSGDGRRVKNSKIAYIFQIHRVGGVGP